jgi:hypothetical protein
MAAAAILNFHRKEPSYKDGVSSIEKLTPENIELHVLITFLAGIEAENDECNAGPS